ncbi:MAG: hypothetical protein NZ750_01830 [Anaerolineae bacterium]|nr:hypothetical protein [Anaerolineae bacterium]MDW8173323.1 hypothetical protein [Anaerolineae bacterium]
MRRPHVAWLSLMILVACAAEDRSAQQTLEASQLRITPIVLTLTFEGSCAEDTYRLEQWLGMSMTARQNLSRLVEIALSQERDKVGRQIELLVSMRNGMASLPAPDCAAEAHRQLIQAIDLGLDMTQSYVSGAVQTLEVKRGDWQRLLTGLDSQYQDLGRLLQALIDTTPAP